MLTLFRRPCRCTWRHAYAPPVPSGMCGALMVAMGNGGLVGAVLSELRSLGKRLSALVRWSFGASDEELPPPPRPLPGPAHGPIPAIDLRRAPQRGEIPPSAGPPPR